MKRKLLYIGGGLFLLIIVAAMPASETEVSVVEENGDGKVEMSEELDVELDFSSDDEQYTYYSIIKVVDGDTLTIDREGTRETIRLIGIDTPETVDPRQMVECFADEASAKARELLTGERVRVELDPSQDERDKYDRLLAYVYRDDGLFINQHLIEEGYGHEYTYFLPYKYQEEFQAAENNARENERGLWAPGICEEAKTAPAPAPKTQSTPAPKSEPVPSTSGYSCSANVYNCGDFSSHAEAQSVYEMCGGVNNDIHRLDRDKDGLACESLP